MKKNISITIALMTSLWVVGCVQVPQEQTSTRSKLAVSSVRDTPIFYAQGSQFTLAPRYVKETSLKPKQTQTVYQFYANAIIKSLKENGFENLNLKNNDNRSNADFYVGFGIALANDLSDQTINEKFGVTPGLPTSEGLDKGSFLIYIEDANTGKKVWRGAAQGFVHEELNGEERQQRTADIVNNVMKQFYRTN